MGIPKIPMGSLLGREKIFQSMGRAIFDQLKAEFEEEMQQVAKAIFDELVQEFKSRKRVHEVIYNNYGQIEKIISKFIDDSVEKQQDDLLYYLHHSLDEEEKEQE